MKVLLSIWGMAILSTIVIGLIDERTPDLMDMLTHSTITYLALWRIK